MDDRDPPIAPTADVDAVGEAVDADGADDRARALLAEVLAHARLPTLPTLALEIIRLCNRDDADLKAIADVLEQDPALTVKVLETVNSSFYGQAYAISTVSHAIVVLGLRSVKTLALGFSLVRELRGSDSAQSRDQWRRALYAASAAKICAERLGLLQAEEAFTAGLLQDLGRFTLTQTHGERYAEILAEVEARLSQEAGEQGAVPADADALLLAVERERLGCDHAALGGMLAEQWKLPPLLSAAIRWHHEPGGALPEVAAIVRCVALGGRIADLFQRHDAAAAPGAEEGQSEREGEGEREADGTGDASLAAAMVRLREQAEADFDWDDAVLEEVLQRSHAQSIEAGELLELDCGDACDVRGIVLAANEALLRLEEAPDPDESPVPGDAADDPAPAADLPAATDRPEPEPVPPRTFQERDPGTGLIGARLLRDTLAHWVAAHVRDGLPLGVIGMTLRHRDAEGASRPLDELEAAALRDLANLVVGSLPEEAVTARIADAHLVMAIPAMSLRATTVAAERCLAALAPLIQELSVMGPALSASLGVVNLTAAGMDSAPHLITGALRGAAAAESAGGNAIRVLRPPSLRPPQAAA